MFLNNIHRRQLLTSLWGGLVLTLFILICTPAPNAQSYILEAKIGDTILSGVNKHVPIPVYLKNQTDSVAGFVFNIFMNRPDLLTFDDTVITEGCLTQDWQFLEWSIFGADSIFIRVVGTANSITDPIIQPAIGYPQLGDVPLFYLMLDIQQTIDSTDATTQLRFEASSPTMFGVSDETGQLIGTELVEFPDTSWFVCLAMNGNECLEYQRVFGPPADSIFVELVTQLRIDTAATHIELGTIEINWLLCGDFTGEDDKTNLSDITRMISYVYLHGDAPITRWTANVDGSPDGKVNLSDITKLIAYVYLGGDPLNCDTP
jgi:hypothetical protein